MGSGSALRLAIGCFAVAFVVAALPIMAWWYLTGSAVEAAELVEIEIAPGTAELVAGGGQPPSLPDGIILGARSRLLVRNQDSQFHRIGGLTIPPGTSREVPASIVVGAAATSRLVCTFHPSGALALGTNEERSPVVALLASAVVALALGGASFGVISVASRLES